MFGYVRYSKLDLTVRDFIKCKTYYCGVCKSIKKNHGETSRCFLNYDATFIATLLSAVYDKFETFTHQKCIFAPLKKKKVIVNKYIDYSADISVLLMYYKMADNHRDQKSLTAYLGMKFFYNNYKKAKENYPDKESVLRTGLEQIHKLESCKHTSLDEISNTFGNIFGELFVYDAKDGSSNLLREIGFNIGKYIYILDSYDDLPNDIKKNHFNPLKNIKFTDVKPLVEGSIYMILDNLEKIIMQLKLLHSEKIIYNVIRLGLKQKATKIFKRMELFL